MLRAGIPSERFLKDPPAAQAGFCCPRSRPGRRLNAEIWLASTLIRDSSTCVAAIHPNAPTDQGLESRRGSPSCMKWRRTGLGQLPAGLSIADWDFLRCCVDVASISNWHGDLRGTEDAGRSPWFTGRVSLKLIIPGGVKAPTMPWSQDLRRATSQTLDGREITCGSGATGSKGTATMPRSRISRPATVISDPPVDEDCREIPCADTSATRDTGFGGILITRHHALPS